MTEELALSIMQMQKRLESNRGTWERHWEEVARYVDPKADEFTGRRTPGEKRSQFIFDDTAVLGLDRFVAAFSSMLTPVGEKWYTVKHKNLTIDKIPVIREWFEEVNNIMFDMRYSPKANFASQINEVYRSLGSFGTGAMLIDDILGEGIRYKSIHLSEIYIMENASGVIDVVYRKFPMTAKQIKETWPEFSSEKLDKAIKDQPEKEFEIVHAVQPDKEEKSGFPFSSTYVFVSEKEVIDESGYRVFPYAISRYVTNPREVYGRSPAMSVLATIKTLNEMEKTNLRSIHQAAMPTYLTADDGVLAKFAIKPHSIVQGGIDENGRQRVQPLQSNARVDLNFQAMDQKRRSVNDAFLVTLFQVLVDTPTMTATEVLERAREKGQLITPTAGRQTSELLSNIIVREFDILLTAGKLPPIPQELLELIGDDGELPFDIEYNSPLTRAQKLEEVIGLQRSIEILTPIAQFDPGVFDVIDTDEATRMILRTQGVQQNIIRPPEEVESIRESRNQQEQTQQLAEQVPGLAGAIKDVAQAQKI